MNRSSWLCAGLALGLISGGCGGESFTETTGTGGRGGESTTSTGGMGGKGGDTTTSSEGGKGGGTGAAGGMGGMGGMGGAGGMGGMGGTGGAPVCQPLVEPCTQCAFDSCQDLYCKCYASNDCPALVNCVSVCDPADTACIQPCLTAHPDSISAAFLLGDCVAAPCGDVCPGTAAQQPCPKCLFEMCSMQMNACLSDPGCYEIIECAIACPPNDFVCAIGCTNGHPSDSINKAVAVQNCTTDPLLCQSACGG